MDRRMFLSLIPGAFLAPLESLAPKEEKWNKLFFSGNEPGGVLEVKGLTLEGWMIHEKAWKKLVQMKDYTVSA